ncbi:MAG TPA: glycosyltransferase [Thermodesulfobacteriota bacterium]
MGAQPRVSVVITSVGRERWLREAIESAVAQRYPRLEVIVVDAGPRGAVRGLIARYGRRVVPLLRPNGTRAAALNAGFEASRGEVVLTLDGDDRLAPEAAARVAAAWRPDVAKVHFRLRVVDAAGRPRGPLVPDARTPLPAGDLRYELLDRFVYPCPPASGNAYGRDALSALLPIPDGEGALGADAYLAACLPFHGRVVAIDAPLGDYRLDAREHRTASAGDTTTRLARAVAQAIEREALVRRTAEAYGFPVPADLALRDPWCAAARLVLRVADRAAYPKPDEGRLFLAARGLAAACRRRDGPAGRRAALAAWFLLVPLLPSRAARRLAPAALERWRAALGEPGPDAPGMPTRSGQPPHVARRVPTRAAW